MAYLLSKLIFWPILKLFIKKIEGLENLPNKPYILVSNHSSYIDAPLLIMMVAWHKNQKIHAFATNQPPFTGWFWDLLFNHYGAIRINGSMQKALQKIKKHPMLIFPEANRTPDGNIQKIEHTGLGVLALKGKVPIIPINMNTFNWWNRWRKLPTFKKDIVIKIGKPLQFKLKQTKQNYRTIVTTTIKEVKKLALNT